MSAQYAARTPRPLSLVAVGGAPLMIGHEPASTIRNGDHLDEQVGSEAVEARSAHGVTIIRPERPSVSSAKITRRAQGSSEGRQYAPPTAIVS